MNVNDFKSNLGITDLPSELENLIDFETNLAEKAYFSDGFSTDPFGRAGLESWSNEDDFLNKLIPFASANGSGSIYAIWLNDSSNSLSQKPIVVFGDEGGTHIVAENILQLLQLLTYDTEIMVDLCWVKFVKEKEKYKESKNLKKYLEWLKENYNLEQIEDPEKIVKVAQDKYKQSFDNWFGKYYKQ